jgi:hypothetical protein
MKRDRRAIREWITKASQLEFVSMVKAAEPGVCCLSCGNENNVLFFDLPDVQAFYCGPCFLIIIAEPEPELNSSGLSIRLRVFDRDGFRCVYCGRNPTEHGVTLEVDHVQPKSKGGSDTMENFVTACFECNRGKGDYILKNIPRI